MDRERCSHVAANNNRRRQRRDRRIDGTVRRSQVGLKTRTSGTGVLTMGELGLSLGVGVEFGGQVLGTGLLATRHDDPA